MNGLLEVIARHAADAERAEAGGADRVELVGTMEHDGLSPEPRLVEQVRAATSLPVRAMLRLREGFGTDGGEVAHLKGLVSAYETAGAGGVSEGLDELVQRARTDDFARRTIMAGGGLLPEHVPWLVRAGVRAFHIGSSARPLGSWKAYVDPDLVRTWRTLIDEQVADTPAAAG